MNTIKKIILAIAVSSASICAVGAIQAEARAVIGGGIFIGTPYYYYPPYYSYPYYAYSPERAYEPPPPPPRYYHNDSGQYCREYSHDVVIEGHMQRAYGTACLQPDGSWKMID